MKKNCWFPFEKERKDGETLLFCFHHAGGSAAVFRDWMKWSRDICVLPVELPGKATRMGEPYARNMEEVAREVSGEIAKMAAGKSIALYGHSMGAALAFSTACHLEEQGIPVQKLLVSGRHSPRDTVVDGYRTGMPDEALIAELRRVGGTPEEFLQSEEILRFILPPLKADYQVNDSYVYHNQKVNCDISAYAGTRDEDAPLELMTGWLEVTRGAFQLQEISGTHFFPIEQGQDFWQKIETELHTEPAKLCPDSFSEDFPRKVIGW